ncbi:MAG: hypothetical protein LBK25_01045 [Treponema sp.]|jgi:hypothetical protein|nr:hypothetical protein [Treponema sp.]
MENLNSLMGRYTAGELGKKDFEGRIFQFIVDNPQYFHLADWDQETYIDYLCWLYPRLSKAIESYRDIGSSFGTYINILVQWSAKEYHSCEIEHSIIEYARWEACARDVYETEPDYLVKDARVNLGDKRKNFATVCQIQILLLKSYAFVSNELIEQVASSINIEATQLKEWISTIKAVRFKHDEEIYRLKEHIHNQFYRCLFFERRLKMLSPSYAKYEKIKKRLERGRIRLAAMKKRLAGFSINASNRLVAEVLGLPKGTVDSNLQAIKRKWKKLKGKI